MKIIFPLLLVSVLLTACFGPQNNDHKNHIYANDFESLFGVLPNVLKGKSHSGDSYFQITDQIEYTPGFSQFFENISPNSFARVKVNAFVYLPEKDIQAELQIQIWDKEGKMLNMKSVPFETRDLGVSQWKKVKLDMDLINDYDPSRQIRIFLYNPYRKSFMLDDFQVTFLQ
ncbi:MAG: hypothetical protein ACKOZZ_12270 [Bacteroidota bacterium]|jgi:hypothetical protein